MAEGTGLSMWPTMSTCSLNWASATLVKLKPVSALGLAIDFD
jgi:hypothetical protein